MKPDKKYRLRIKSLNFISAVDRPAQEGALAVLVKRAGVDALDAAVIKVDAELGLVFGWALQSTVDGKPYHDLQGDAISEEEMVKAAAEFMAGTRAMDTMHDGEKVGEVVFAMPMTAEIATAYGVDAKGTHGLMIAVKPPEDVLAKFKSGEFTGFSIAGFGEREAVKRADDVGKRVRMTTSVDGHAHLVYDDTLSGGQTSYGRADDSEMGHDHPWIRLDDGTIQIGESEGHTHGLASTDKPAAKRAIGAEEQRTMTTDADRIKKLEADLQHANAVIAFSDAERTFYRTLVSPLEQDAFIAKSAAERLSAINSDPVVYKAADGTEIRKSQDPTGIAVRALKRADEAEALAKKNAAHAEDVELEKRATALLKHLPGEVAVRKALLSAVECIPDEGVRKAALATLKAADEAMAKSFVEAGGNGATQPGTGGAREKFDAIVAKYAAEKGVSKSIAVMKLTDGPERNAEACALYEQIYAEAH